MSIFYLIYFIICFFSISCICSTLAPQTQYCMHKKQTSPFQTLQHFVHQVSSALADILYLVGIISYEKRTLLYTEFFSAYIYWVMGCPSFRLSHIGKPFHRFREILDGPIRISVLQTILDAMPDMSFQHDLPALMNG